jgi:hypothetical protein
MQKCIIYKHENIWTIWFNICKSYIIQNKKLKKSLIHVCQQANEHVQMKKMHYKKKLINEQKVIL